MDDLYLIPCGAAKLDHAAPACELYTSSTFRMALAAALAQVDGDRDRVLILSARHGLVGLDDVLDPYDTKMGDPDAIDGDTLAWQLVERGALDADVWSFLPRAYFDAIDAPAKQLGIWIAEGYEATAGIGEQRRVLALSS